MNVGAGTGGKDLRYFKEKLLVCFSLLKLDKLVASGMALTHCNSCLLNKMKFFICAVWLKRNLKCMLF